jgi:hypothetical protein
MKHCIEIEPRYHPGGTTENNNVVVIGLKASMKF